MGLGLVEFSVSEGRPEGSRRGGDDGGRCLTRECVAWGRRKCRRVERVVAMREHALGKPLGDGLSVDAEVMEHRIRFPTPEELDGTRVDVSTEQRGGPTGPEVAGGNMCRVDASACLDECENTWPEVPRSSDQ